jgi:hypothetical protein
MANDELALVVYRDDQVVLLFGDDEAGLGRARAAAERAGCRVAHACSIADAEARLDRQVAVRAALVVAQEPSGALERLLARLNAEGRSGRLRPIIVAPEAMIDTATQAGLGWEADHLIDPTDEELAIAVALATGPAPSRLHDVGRGPGTGLLQQLSQEAARLASMLASLSAEDAGAARGPAMPGEAQREDQVDAGFVRSIIRARRLRDQYFRGELFADPAWDMLLDLYAARLEGDRVAVSSLCIAAAVPATTALRWIKALTDRGLLHRSADPQDGRRVYIELSADTAKAMGAYLAMAQRVSATII